MAKILEQCPTCQSRMEITQLSCTNCETVVLGRFEPNRFSKLPPRSLAFLEAFVSSRGNVKEMARELGISYWTIRKQLDDLIDELGFETKSEASAGKAGRREVLERLRAGGIDRREVLERLRAGGIDRREVLERLRAGEIDPDEAARLLGDT